MNRKKPKMESVASFLLRFEPSDNLVTVKVFVHLLI